MKIILLCGLLGTISAEILPSSTYGAPNGGFSNGFGFGAANGASNGFGAPSNGYSAPSNSYGLPNGGYGVDPEIAALSENIPGGGVPGEDYPILASVPDTGFSCDAQAVQGYYADTAAEAGCQVFHICQDRALRRQQDSFLCPNGTIFNQQYLVCDWWFNVDCSQAESFYSVNELIGVVPDAGEALSALPSPREAPALRKPLHLSSSNAWRNVVQRENKNKTKKCKTLSKSRGFEAVKGTSIIGLLAEVGVQSRGGSLKENLSNAHSIRL
ncbi:hypothetical protein C7M84_005413 [Penaeus vannamei]|uniref:Chitin-binding type-2 domain-containing protein n=1 Tax=Penaeus vannamei TaxID=6689 RepID=A0A423THQ7_PENVA|nr:hypothetical protein C7M84_005413 [Penaeus vannamei]